VLRLLLEKTGAGLASAEIAVHLGLIPQQVVHHGWIWQLLTYSIIHGGFFHLFFNMLMLWMFGANLEIHFGSRQFLEFFFFGVLDARVGGGTATIAHLGGLLFGYLYLKFVPRRGLTFAFSESYFSIRNSYHRWKRRKASKKFEVYMSKHEKEPNKYFAEYGNF